MVNLVSALQDSAIVLEQTDHVFYHPRQAAIEGDKKQG